MAGLKPGSCSIEGWFAIKAMKSIKCTGKVTQKLKG